MAIHKITLTCLCGKIHGEQEITEEELLELERLMEEHKKALQGDKCSDMFCNNLG